VTTALDLLAIFAALFALDGVVGYAQKLLHQRNR